MLPSILAGNMLWGTQLLNQPAGWNCKAKNVFHKAPHSGMGWSTHFSWDCNEHQSPTCTCSDLDLTSSFFFSPALAAAYLAPLILVSVTFQCPINPHFTLFCGFLKDRSPQSSMPTPYLGFFFFSFLTRPPSLCFQTSFLLVFLLFTVCSGVAPL